METPRRRATRQQVHARTQETLEGLLAGTQPTLLYRDLASRHSISWRQAVRYGVKAHAEIAKAMNNKMQALRREQEKASSIEERDRLLRAALQIDLALGRNGRWRLLDIHRRYSGDTSDGDFEAEQGGVLPAVAALHRE